MRKLLFTPGPLTTSDTVKQAMLVDYGSRDPEFINLVREVRTELLHVGGVSQADGYECVIMQGSGTFAVESVLVSAVPDNGKLLVLANGAYGERMAQIATCARLPFVKISVEENEPVTAALAEKSLAEHPDVTHVAMIHSETTTGLFNPVKEVAAVCKKHGKTVIVDAMSSFGGVQMNIRDWHIDYLVSSANKCVEGVPGFAFVITTREQLELCSAQKRSLSLDLYTQWKGLETNGQFRFTPPTHVLAAYRQALRELEAEGGVAARENRYQQNRDTIRDGLKAIGVELYLPEAIQGHIILSFLLPTPDFDFNRFYQNLFDRGCIIYPGKLTRVDTFRIGCIGQLFPKDYQFLLEQIKEVFAEMGVRTGA